MTSANSEEKPIANSTERILAKIIKNKFKTFENAKKLAPISFFLNRIKKETPDKLSRRECLELIEIMRTI